MTQLNDMLDIERPLPPARSFSAPFWEATREKRLVIQYDRVAGAYQFYPRPTSIHTGRRGNLEWREVSGLGQVFSYTIVRRARPPFRDREPYIVAMVTLDEGVNVMSNIIRCTEEELAQGLRVKPYWHPLSDGRHLLLFEPDR
ncbi:Zn-ribbon domain-containing OB-fold protein [Sphingomonas canadensis]|uniref:Zn-ribbon domain-containing OB-fold protein n=1 Tax=Sphingomonas canadensis TaxID=1219257 RepID=A0ABW3H8W0_9SPHN|nr:Zn-ribbon domain-containing OB-fold protein [Sphingomonas canadensis]MCW3837610.1 Zn-ribbon domain-containing OB-fold protein [Sphingomonas canadensis]